LRRIRGKITPKLTANYGLRYEYSVLPQPTVTNPNYPETGHIPSAGKNFAPRIGLAYALNDKTVIRAGYGLYYARYVAAMIQNLFQQQRRLHAKPQHHQFRDGRRSRLPVHARYSGRSAGRQSLDYLRRTEHAQSLHRTVKRRHRAGAHEKV